MSSSFPLACGDASPRGAIQTVEPRGPAVGAVTTAAHGGLRVSAAAVARSLRAISQTAESWGGWIEADCDGRLAWFALGLGAFESDAEVGGRAHA